MLLINFLTQKARKYLVGPEQKFEFKKIESEKVELSKIEKIGIYIHIPFCKSLCPYCPYNKIKYDKNLISPYLSAILKEIDLYYKKFGRIEISSIYIGGGTPTNMIDELEIILNSIKKKFLLTGDICIETSVSDINKTTVEKLKNCEINLVSLGVQSFQDKFLKFLSRNYQEQSIKKAIDLLKEAKFKSINIDLMFALTGQTIDNLKLDLECAIESGVDQITTYPLFTFPYTSIGSFLNLKKIKMPNIFVRRKMYKFIHNFLIEKGFDRVSVWGFKKGTAPRYSSVTRDYYIGLGAGAASSFQNLFYFNSFSVTEYIKKLSQNNLPIAIKMDITDSLSKNYWFYWKLYDTFLNISDIKTVFGHNSKIEKLIKLFNFLNLCKINGEQIYLTERGSFWIHLIQNYFILNYINKVWTVAGKNPWPEKIEF